MGREEASSIQGFQSIRETQLRLVRVGRSGQGCLVWVRTDPKAGRAGKRTLARRSRAAGTANCLVIRFGNGRWIEAGPFWEGSPDANSGGRLQLNVNDNNPYNG
jgi:hypothetical protein